MTGISRPHSLAILDRRPEYARLLAALATADHPALAVATFDDPVEAERWLDAAAGPIAVLVDVTAGDGAAIARAEAWRHARGVALIATFDAANENEALLAAMAPADATLPKPCCHAEWTRSFGALMQCEALAKV
jgi:hypothetical protein